MIQVLASSLLPLSYKLDHDGLSVTGPAGHVDFANLPHLNGNSNSGAQAGTPRLRLGDLALSPVVVAKGQDTAVAAQEHRVKVAGGDVFLREQIGATCRMLRQPCQVSYLRPAGRSGTLHCPHLTFEPWAGGSCC